MTAYQAIKAAAERQTLPNQEQYLSVLQAARHTLSTETPELRPRDDSGKPGGLVRLHRDLPTIIVPDLHARRGFLMSLLDSPAPAGFTTAGPTSTPGPGNRTAGQGEKPETVVELLDAGKVQLLCLGDGFHAESRAMERWRSAYAEYVGGYGEHRSMDQEMCESLGLMEMVMLVKTAFPAYFHFLKGNHENVLNETGNGNYGFYKFVQEGAMVLAYLERFYRDTFVQSYSDFEKSLPLFARGQHFLASHAEPARLFTEPEVINAALLPEVILGLTWTDNEEATPGTVATMLQRFLPGIQRPRYITGHRPISGLFHERSSGLHLQIHNPDRCIVVWARADRDLEPEKDIRELASCSPSR